MLKKTKGRVSDGAKWSAAGTSRLPHGHNPSLNAAENGVFLYIYISSKTVKKKIKFKHLKKKEASLFIPTVCFQNMVYTVSSHVFPEHVKRIVVLDNMSHTSIPLPLQYC